MTSTGHGSSALVSLAAVTWAFKLVGRTRMLTEAWARIGQPTVFVQVPSYRTALERVLSFAQPRAPIPVIRPWPSVPSRRWGRYGQFELEKRIRRRARALRKQLERRVDLASSTALVISPVWTPWLEELPFGRVIYDCIDELRVQIPRAEHTALYEDWERRLVQCANGAVVTAERLRAGLAEMRPDLPLQMIRNGVDAEWFQQRAAEDPPPADVPRGDNTVIGFVGALYEWIDWSLIEAVAARLPEYKFVFVGPHDGRSDVQRVQRLTNVHLLGARLYERVPAYINSFDVCWVPFVQDDVGAAANPVKLYEYLALGKPTVTTPVADTDTFGDVLAVADNVGDMVDCLRAACVVDAAKTEARLAFARANTWEARGRDYVEFVASLGSEGTSRSSSVDGVAGARPSTSS